MTPPRRRPRPGGRIELRNSKRVPPAELKRLFRESGWTEDIVRYSPSRVRKLLRQSHLVLTAWDDKKMVGFASVVSDGTLCGLVQNLLVHPRYRGRGLGTRLLRHLTRFMRRQGVTFLYALGGRGPQVRTFLNRAGFRRLTWSVFLRHNH